MLTDILKKIFGSRNDRIIRQYQAIVRKINELEPSLEKLSDAELTGRTAEYKQRFQNGESLDALLPEAFATVREASKRVLGMRHFDEQLIGGITLHNGKIAEMRTGEGKTLVATLPSYLNAISGLGVHVVTVNDYLAKRDSGWMGRIHSFLGLTVGVIYSDMPHGDKQAAYGADITYGTNNEFGFDYLRDNMASAVSERYQRTLNFAIVDEVDSILIDEARTPLIISGQAEDDVSLYYRINEIVPRLVRGEMKEAKKQFGQVLEEEEPDGDYVVDEKSHQVILTEQGHIHAEELMAESGLLTPGTSLYDATNITLMHHLNASLRAHSLFNRDTHYVVQDGEVIIVDEFTGRLMSGRRWSDGLHQAVEAKEGVEINKENQTLASITFQNYFRMYRKLSGMTGTADTEAFEFHQIYNLETIVIPTHRPMVRKDNMDKVYRSSRERYQAVLEDIRDCHQRNQPVLVGTTSIETSELVSGLLKKAGLPHQVLNAKQHAREAEIVAQAGKPGAITIATNMAGRGTDIVLGGYIEPEIDKIKNDANLDQGMKDERIARLRSEWQERHDAVLKTGGLHIIGTERHESRRIDNQLRGRSGRQGDAGSSRFYLSLEDQLLRIFASDRVAAIMDRLNMPEGEAIEHPWVTRAIENAQRKVEARNFDIRKQLLEYDDVANDQRKAIYSQRNEILESDNVSATLRAMREDVISDYINLHVPPDSLEEQWDISGLEQVLASEIQIHVPVRQWLESDPNLTDQQLRERIIEIAHQTYDAKVAAVGSDIMHHFERAVTLQNLDHYYREHLSALDHLRQGIHLRGYAQKNPKQEYKREAFELFAFMLDTIKREVTKITMVVQIRGEQDVAPLDRPENLANVEYKHPAYAEGDEPELSLAPAATPVVVAADSGKVGRNDPCPCGSGKKYKHCHGRLT